ncbi:hypothetical protein [Kosmotoga pacifica]|uniref:Right handed beta helix domain-containing protein n=1 Tax=Kosmotoga pacifica TaxID=1330330 RepID=A0A0G2ZEA3_9BACT|nr:hypothetical protein [Kosmotoga pacifica]AKI97148.1 hypothetical protein IX53_04220 [Kosmotoga pacifica]
MKRSLKVTIGVAISLVALLVLFYFVFWTPRTITVSALFPTGATGNPTIKAVSSVAEVTLSKNEPSAKLKVKRKDTVEFRTLEGVLLDREDVTKDTREIKFGFPEPRISEFNYIFSEDGKQLILNWDAISSPYSIDSVIVKRNGTVISRKGNSYSDAIIDFQGKTLSYELIVGYKYGPVYIEKSEVLTVKVPLLPVEVEVKVILDEGLNAEKVQVLLDDTPVTLNENGKAIFSRVEQGKHRISLKYDTIELFSEDEIFRWNEDIPYLFEFPIYAIEISELSATRKGDSLKLSWKSDLKSYHEKDVSYLLKLGALSFNSTQTSYELKIPEETSTLTIVPMYRGVPFGPEKVLKVMGKPFFEIGSVPLFVPSNELKIDFKARNLSELQMELDSGSPVNIDIDKGSVTFKDLSEGPHSISFRAKDLYGETLMKNATFTVDTTPPNEPEILEYRIEGNRIIVELGITSDTVSVYGEVLVSDDTIYHIETESNQIVLPVPAPNTGFTGTLEFFLTAVDRAGNESMKASYEVKLVDFEKILSSLNFDVIQKDYKPITVRIVNSKATKDASVTVIVETPKGQNTFVYDLSKPFNVLEPIEGTYFGDLKISYKVNTLGIESPTVIATETTVDLKNLEGFYVYQVDEDGKFRVRFYPVPDPDVRYRIRRKLLDTPVNQEIKTVLPEEVKLDDDPPVVKDFDSPFSLTSEATIEVCVEVEILTDYYSYKFPEKKLTLYKGATILTGTATTASFDENAYPILIAENYVIPQGTEVYIKGDGLLLIQDGASFVVNGRLEISGNREGVLLKSESGSGIMLYGGELRLKNVHTLGRKASLFASGAVLNIEDSSFQGTSNPLIIKNGSSVRLINVELNSVGTAGYISDSDRFEAHNVRINNSSKGFIILNPDFVLIQGYQANEGIKDIGLEIKDSDSEEISLEDIDISSKRFALSLENLKKVSLSGAHLEASGFYVIALSNIEEAQISDVSVTGLLKEGRPNIGFFIASSGGTLKNISVSYCKGTGLYINNRLLPASLMKTYKKLLPKEKENWAPLSLYTDASNFSKNELDIYLEGIYNLYAPGLELDQLKIYDYRVDKTWSNELGKLFPRGSVIVK